MRTQSSKSFNSSRTFFLIIARPVTPDAEATEQESGAELHDDQGIDLLDLAEMRAVEETGDEREKEDGICV